MSDAPAALSDWIEGEKRRLDEFAAWWIAERPRNSELFPEAMPLGEWDEQYRSWGGG